jgi:predicted ABC-type ATPase
VTAPVLFVLAGVNGTGKSSLGGASLRRERLDYFNPDEAARRIREQARCPVAEANALAWNEGRRRLEAAIESRSSHAFESTLGGNTIPRLIGRAADAGFDVLIWFIGLSGPEQAIARVRARVASGGHDIPEETIRQRWDTSRRNLIALLPRLAELKVFDNSRQGDPASGTIPEPRLLLHWRAGTIVSPSPAGLAKTPEWAKPIVGRALGLGG